MATIRRAKITRVEGVDLSKVDEQKVRAAYRDAHKAQLGMSEPPMELPDEGGLELKTAISNLVLWYRSSVPGTELCDCQTCGGDSDARLAACPFCGDAEEIQGREGMVSPQPAAVVPATSKKVAKKDKPGPAVEVVVVDKAAGEVGELDEIVTVIQELKKQAALDVWNLGVQISRIMNGRLWMLRLDEGGRPIFKSFNQFCRGELGLSYRHAFRLAKIAEAFTQDTMERIGVAKCSVILQLPPDMRQEAADKASGQSVADVSDAARRLRDGNADAAPPPGALTVAMAPGMVELQLLARPKGKPNANKTSDEPARSMQDQPWAFEQLSNRVQVYYSVFQAKDGTWMLKIDRRRVSKTETVMADERTATAAKASGGKLKAGRKKVSKRIAKKTTKK